MPNHANVFYCDRWYPGIDSFFAAAVAAGYPFFEWNFGIYQVMDDGYEYIGPASLYDLGAQPAGLIAA